MKNANGFPVLQACFSINCWSLRGTTTPDFDFEFRTDHGKNPGPVAGGGGRAEGSTRLMKIV